MKRVIAFFVLLSVCLAASAQKREYIWPKKLMPDNQPHQIAAMTDVSRAEGFVPDKYRRPYLDWYEAPANPNGGCMILISGGGYQYCCDVDLVETWHRELTALGFQCVNFVYRTPRPEGLPIYQSAWEDGQRAVRLVRSQAKKRGFDPEKIGTISMSAGSHLALMLATSSLTRAYAPVDKTDSIPCHINWAIVNAPAYVTTDSEAGTRATKEGFGPEVQLSSAFKFDEKTCPMSLHHGGKDPYTPFGSTLIYRKLHLMQVPCEVHIYPDKGHKALGFERGVEFMRQMGFLDTLAEEVPILERIASDEDRGRYIKQDVWPEGKMPDRFEGMCEPYIEWHFPKELKTKAIQIIFSGGAYKRNNPNNMEVAPVRRYLNEKGMTVVTLKYRSPRPPEESGLQKHTCAWEDLQRTIKLVRKQAPSFGLDPDRIGVMGGSAGGHLSLMGALSSTHQSYLPIDKTDKIPCNVQWAVALYPAYSYKPEDGYSPELCFDIKTAPVLFIHGDADYCVPYHSLGCWERMRAMGVQSELHILALRNHGFQRTASPGTGSYTFIDRIWEFLVAKGFVEGDI